MSLTFPLRVTFAGSPSSLAGPIYEHAIVLKGNLTAHYGVTIGTPCRLEEDPASPLRFSAIGELEYTKAETKPRDATERWVLLQGDEDAVRAAVDLWRRQVRIVYEVPRD